MLRSFQYIVSILTCKRGNYKNRLNTLLLQLITLEPVTSKLTRRPNLHSYLHSVICSALTSNQSNWFNANQEKRELSDGKSSHQRNSSTATMDVPINIFFQ